MLPCFYIFIGKPYNDSILKRIEGDEGLDKLTIDQIAQVGAYNLINGLADKNADYTPDNFRAEMVAGSEQLLAPNGKPSNLTPFQHAQVRTAQFIKWIGLNYLDGNYSEIQL